MIDSLPRPVLILIDGHALAYRQFYALPIDRFSTPEGEPTNATYGFARTLLDLLEMFPDYLAVSFDQGKSGREQLFPEYKGTRAKMSDLMWRQMDRIRELVESFNIPILEHEDTEADDVIGTAARQSQDRGVQVYIMTGDHDLLQLVTEQTHVWLPPGKGQNGYRTYDRARVIEEYGIGPEQIPDFKALVGDQSDNIPGVSGIGDKTAATLLQQYGTLAQVFDHLDEQKPKLREKLVAGRDSAFLSKNLATIRTDVPITLELEKCVARDYDRAVVADLFRKLTFRSLLARLTSRNGAPATSESKPNGNGSAQTRSANEASGQQMTMFGASADAPVPAIVDTVTVDTPEKLAELVSVLDKAEAIAFDTETTGLTPLTDKLVGISLAVDSERGYYIPVGHVTPDGLFGTAPRQLPLETVIDALKPAMSDPRKPKWAHNAAFDVLMLNRNGLDISPLTFDTMIAEWVVNPDSRTKGLKDQAALRLKVDMTPITDLIGKGKSQITMDRVSIERAAPYAAADAVMTYRLVDVLRAELEQNSLWALFTEVEMPLVPVLIGMHIAGARLDLPYLHHLSTEFRQRQDALQQQIYQAAGQTFNLNSLRELNRIFFDVLQLSPEGLGRTQHGYSLDADALEQLKDQHSVVSLLLDWRGLEKLRNTYVDALPTMVDTHDRVHTTYNQIGASTGRLSSEDPNLQNIPVRTEEGRRVRRAFIAAPGHHLLSVDYSQIELRILAHYSHEPFMIDAFDSGLDIHTATAAAVFNVPYEQVTKDQRYLAKRVNFGLMYGMGAYRLGKEAGLKMSDATEFINRYFARLPAIQQYLQSSKDLAAKQGYLETIFGRRRYFRMLQHTGDDRASAVVRARMEREAINMPVQGTNADIIKHAMIRLPDRLRARGYQARLILQVHDELVLEVPDAEIVPVAALVCEVMEAAGTLDVPLKTEAKVGLNWTDMQPLEDWQAARVANTPET